MHVASPPRHNDVINYADTSLSTASWLKRTKAKTGIVYTILVKKLCYIETTLFPFQVSWLLTFTKWLQLAYSNIKIKYQKCNPAVAAVTALKNETKSYEMIEELSSEKKSGFLYLFVTQINVRARDTGGQAKYKFKENNKPTRKTCMYLFLELLLQVEVIGTCTYNIKSNLLIFLYNICLSSSVQEPRINKYVIPKKEREYIYRLRLLYGATRCS